jgi:hypothetical protein
MHAIEDVVVFILFVIVLCYPFVIGFYYCFSLVVFIQVSFESFCSFFCLVFDDFPLSFLSLITHLLGPERISAQSAVGAPGGSYRSHLHQRRQLGRFAGAAPNAFARSLFLGDWYANGQRVILAIIDHS